MDLRKTLAYFQGKTVFISGHTGFKGSWMTYLLASHGVRVVGYALSPNTTPNLFDQLNLSHHCESIIQDINHLSELTKAIVKAQPDYIFHLAAQPLVRYSYQNPIETFATNVMGTANLLEACKSLHKKCSVVCITTDKVYQNREWVYPYRETDTLGGHDPYSASKAAAEIVIDSYRKSFFSAGAISIASARAGNVIGGGDWSEDRLIPDIAKSIARGEAVVLRNPHAVRPWQHVLDPIFGYLLLAKKMDESEHEFNESWNFGPANHDVKSVSEVVNKFCEVNLLNPVFVQDSNNNPHEANTLKLDISKSIARLTWRPKFNSDDSIILAANWYNQFQKGIPAVTLVADDIKEYLLK
jgi:CDP-glucose 4,6-dehydratase